MIGRDFQFRDGKKGAALAVRTALDRPENRIEKVLGDGTVQIGVKGKPKNLNIAVVELLSELLEIDSKRIDLIPGKDGDDKLLSILDIEPADLQKLILSKIP